MSRYAERRTRNVATNSVSAMPILLEYNNIIIFPYLYEYLKLKLAKCK